MDGVLQRLKWLFGIGTAGPTQAGGPPSQSADTTASLPPLVSREKQLMLGLQGISEDAAPPAAEPGRSAANRRAIQEAHVALKKVLQEIQEFADASGVYSIPTPDGSSISAESLRMIANRISEALDRVSNFLTQSSVDQEKKPHPILTCHDIQVLVEDLRSTAQPRAVALAASLDDLFWPYFELQCEEVGGVFTKTKATVRKAEQSRTIVCAACVNPAAKFELEMDAASGKPKLAYSGLMLWPKPARATCSTRDSDFLFQLIDEGNVAGADQFLARFVNENRSFNMGIDVYCSECDAVYCKGHWYLREETDEGFYDGTNGRCPRMHWRSVED